MCVHLDTHVFENVLVFVSLFFKVGLSSHVTQVNRKKSCFAVTGDFCKDWTWHLTLVKLHQRRTCPSLFHFADFYKSFVILQMCIESVSQFASWKTVVFWFCFLVFFLGFVCLLFCFCFISTCLSTSDN